MLQLGYIKAMVYTSDAQIPIENAVFTVSKNFDDETQLIGVRITDAEGKTSVIPVEAPDASLSQHQGNVSPYAEVDIRVDHPDYKTFYVSDAQVFAGQVSIQEVLMQPADKNTPTDQRAERFYVTGQNL